MAAREMARPHRGDLLVALLRLQLSDVGSRTGYIDCFVKPPYALQARMHASRQDQNFDDEIDSARVSTSSRTPMHSALERCARLVSADTIDEVTAELASLLRSGVHDNVHGRTLALATVCMTSGCATG
jgi:hypothetical protein